ncbi:hypothetical protein [Parasediminibacterium sp. JCM 36343]|uniref:hypothetical protein n=1 Tax=Parasediminibacterium sp. JCM 36343 TaxID=3374279 RepID=UPI00397E3CBD
MTNFELIPASLSKKLLGLTINEALQQGIITSVGDEQGNFIFADGEHPDVFYALINNYIVRCSESVTSSGLEIASIAGGLVFYKFLQNGEESCKIGMPHTVKLGYVVSQLPR